MSEKRHSEKYLQEVQEVLVHPFLPLDQILPEHSERRKIQKQVSAFFNEQLTSFVVRTLKVYSQQNL